MPLKKTKHFQVSLEYSKNNNNKKTVPKSAQKKEKTTTNHINQLRDRESEFDDDNICDVLHWPGPLVISLKELFEEEVFGMCMSPLVSCHSCGQTSTQIDRQTDRQTGRQTKQILN